MYLTTVSLYIVDLIERKEGLSWKTGLFRDFNCFLGFTSRSTEYLKLSLVNNIYYIRTRQLTVQGIVNQILDTESREILILAKRFMSEPLIPRITATNAFLMQLESRFLDHVFIDTNLILACV